MDKLGKIAGVEFSTLVDPAGDSATFLNILLPDTDSAKRVVEEFNKNGVGGFNYWYVNMYHFINQWNHLKELKAAAKLPIHHFGTPQDYLNLNLPKSQEVIGRLISFGIRVTWTEEELKNLSDKISACIQKALATIHA